MKLNELGLQKYIIDYCESKNIPIDLRFACFGDENKFYHNDTEFSLEYSSYHSDNSEDIKRLFAFILDVMWEHCTHPLNRLALYVKDTVAMDDWYEVTFGYGAFTDEALV